VYVTQRRTRTRVHPFPVGTATTPPEYNRVAYGNPTPLVRSGQLRVFYIRHDERFVRVISPRLSLLFFSIQQRKIGEAIQDKREVEKLQSLPIFFYFVHL
jgi:hypothetical protein